MMDPDLKRQWKEHIDTWWRDVPRDDGSLKREIMWVDKGEGPPEGDGWQQTTVILPVPWRGDA